jgi:hypothetical protein
MSKKPLDPRDFVVTDPFGRTLNFYVANGHYYRRDLTPANDVGDGGEIRSVSEIVYALRWLERCLKEM